MRGRSPQLQEPKPNRYKGISYVYQHLRTVPSPEIASHVEEETQPLLFHVRALRMQRANHSSQNPDRWQLENLASKSWPTIHLRSYASRGYRHGSNAHLQPAKAGWHQPFSGRKGGRAQGKCSPTELQISPIPMTRSHASPWVGCLDAGDGHVECSLCLIKCHLSSLLLRLWNPQSHLLSRPSFGELY